MRFVAAVALVVLCAGCVEGVAGPTTTTELAPLLCTVDCGDDGVARP